MKDILINTVLFIVGMTAIAGAVWYVSINGNADYKKEIRTISEREIVDFTVVEDVFGSIVAYTYTGDKLPEKLAGNEVIEMRTESSYTRQIGFENKGTSEENIILELVSYPQKTFVVENGVWYYAKYDEISKDIFYKAKKKKLHSKLFINVAYADYTTTKLFYSGAGDGSVGKFGFGTWAGIHNSTTGLSATSIGTTMSVLARLIYDFELGDSVTINRAFLPFDTSSIPASASISSATLNMYVTAKVNTDNDGTDYVTVVQTSQSDHTTLTTADYNQCGSVSNPIEGIAIDQRKDITSISTSAYISFTLNSTGMGWIKKNGESSNCSSTDGVSCFGLREGHDAINTPIATDKFNSVTMSTSEETGTSQDPYLSVTYKVLNFAPWAFQVY